MKNLKQLDPNCGCDNGGGTLNRQMSGTVPFNGGVVIPGQLGFLVDPMDIPQQVLLNGTIAASDTPQTYLFLDDSLGLASQLGLLATSTGAGTAMTAGGGITAAILKEYLKTYALIVVGYNFQSSQADQLTQNLRLLYNTIDGNGKNKQMFSSQSVSNMQYNANLLNVDQNFVWTHTTALKINCTANAAMGAAITYNFNFKIAGAVPYGKLPEYLTAARIPERSKINC